MEDNGTTVIPDDELEGGREGDVEGIGELVLYLASGFTKSKALPVSTLLLLETDSVFSGVVFLLISESGLLDRADNLGI